MPYFSEEDIVRTLLFLLPVIIETKKSSLSEIDMKTLEARVVVAEYTGAYYDGYRFIGVTEIQNEIQRRTGSPNNILK